MNLPTATDFENEIRRRWAASEARGLSHVDIRAGDMHRHLGGYPSRAGNHRMPDCCQVMRRLMSTRDRTLNIPKSGQGASLVIRYALPR